MTVIHKTLMKKCWVEVGRAVFGFVTLAFGKEGERGGESRGIL
jgi:hypothetical protein